MFNAFKISSSGMHTERVRLEAISSNIANANNTSVTNGQVYKRKQVLLKEGDLDFSSTLKGVQVAKITEDKSADKLVYDPDHADAIQTGEYAGYVRYPNVDIAKELVDLTNAQRAYEVNSQTFSATRGMIESSLNIIK